MSLGRRNTKLCLCSGREDDRCQMWDSVFSFIIIFFSEQIQGKGKGYLWDSFLPLLILKIDQIIGRYFTFVNQFLLLIFLKKLANSKHKNAEAFN